MFDFEKLDVYQHVKSLNIKVLGFLLQNQDMDERLKEQWKNSSLNITLKLAEGTAKMTNADKKHFLTLSRGGVFESVALLQAVHGLGMIDDGTFSEFYEDYEKASKMLLGMYRSYDK